ncbi:zinc finger protein 318 [Cinnamomum micranthum f. kanehirae]|uniref:Zinc finger protein 318 n=1 Tax=Cinnamomum micranthum f. kanehirae TaxID=337451 RepID=A0A443PKF0_9MAGN|nr:zinc finger protein 318 [Cinnamomum micranthum f. kanehirae]
MEFKFRAGDDRHARFPAQARQAGYSVPNLGRPGQLQNPMIPSRGALPREMEKERIREEIIASEILLRKRELEEEVRRDLAYEREVALRRQGEQFSLQGGMMHKSKGEGLVIAMKPGGSNNKASASSYPPPHKPYKPQKPAKQVGGGGVAANRHQSKPQNVVGKQPMLHVEHCKVKCNSVPHLMGGKKQHVPMQEHKAPVNKGNGKGGADVKVRVVVQVKQGKNEVVVSSGTALKPNKPGSNGNNKAKGKPQVAKPFLKLTFEKKRESTGHLHLVNGKVVKVSIEKQDEEIVASQTRDWVPSTEEMTERREASSDETDKIAVGGETSCVYHDNCGLLCIFSSDLLICRFSSDLLVVSSIHPQISSGSGFRWIAISWH